MKIAWIALATFALVALSSITPAQAQWSSYLDYCNPHQQNCNPNVRYRYDVLEGMRLQAEESRLRSRLELERMLAPPAPPADAGAEPNCWGVAHLPELWRQCTGGGW